jgi:hypothetical protein
LLLFYFLRHVDWLDLKRSVALGAVLGLSTLTSSSTLIFAPVMVVLILLFAPAARPAVKASAVMVLTAALLVAPWTLRNYLVFDEFVPVRTGVGQIAHAGTVALGQTFAPESTDVPVPAPWTASGPFEATARAYSVRPNRLALHDWQMKAIAAQYGPGYDRLNEAQRDERHLQEVREFMVANPLLTTRLAIPKLTRFVLSGGWPTDILTIAVPS